MQLAADYVDHTKNITWEKKWEAYGSLKSQSLPLQGQCLSRWDQ
jgi:hypothetical protein